MEKIEVLNQNNVQPEAKEILDNIKAKIGRVPNVYAVLAHSPRALQGFLQFRDKLNQGEFSPKEIEAIALVVSQETDCMYCLAAHSAIAKMQGIPAEEILRLRKASSSDAKVAALAVLTRDIIVSRGNPAEPSLKAFFDAGYSKAALVELLAQISLNIFTTYFNKIAQPPVDFPAVAKLA